MKRTITKRMTSSSVIHSHHCSSRLLSSRNHNYGRRNCSLSPKTAARLEPPSCHPNQSNSTVLNLLGFISVSGNRREAGICTAGWKYSPNRVRKPENMPADDRVGFRRRRHSAMLQTRSHICLNFS